MEHDVNAARLTLVWALLLALFALACSDDTAATTSDAGADTGGSDTGDADAAPLPCADGLPAAVTTSVETIIDQLAFCYGDNGAECADDDATLVTAATHLIADVTASCSETEIASLQAGPSADSTIEATAWADRLAAQALQSGQALSRTVFGGPLGIRLEEGDSSERSCLEQAYEALTSYYEAVVAEKLGCLMAESCDAGDVAALLESARAGAAEAIDTTCGDDIEIITTTVDSLLDYAAQQADCTVAAAVPGGDAVEVACGPSNPNVAAVDEVGEWIAVTLPFEVWGSRCADGSDFSFWFRLGDDPASIFIDLQGGGVCLDEERCRSASTTGHFDTDDEMDAPPSNQWVEDSDANPFADWTYAFLPYCNQDVFSGGGILEELNDDTSDPAFPVYRYGGRNVQAATRYVRDAVWRYLDETSPDGYRAENVRAMLAGTSAGGFGVYNNHHYMLDLLGWDQSVANPRVWLSLSSPTTPIEGIYLLKLDTWALRDVLPTYCNERFCASGPGFLPVHAARLDERSQFLIASGQVDIVQQRETFHPSIFTWVNLAREYYCNVVDAPHTAWFFPANPEPIQALIDGDEFTPQNNGHSVGDQFVIDGVTLRDWLGDAVESPSTVDNLVEEGDLATLSQDESLDELPYYEPIEPFTCLE